MIYYSACQLHLLTRLAEGGFQPVKLHGGMVLSAYSLERLGLVKVVLLGGHKHAVAMDENAKAVAQRITDSIRATR